METGCVEPAPYEGDIRDRVEVPEHADAVDDNDVSVRRTGRREPGAR